MISAKKIVNGLDKSSDYLLMTCLGVMAIVLFMQVFFRYVLNAPLTWGEELARYLHVWIALMGIRFGLKYNAHLNIAFLFDRLPKMGKHIVNILVNTFLVVCIIIYLPGAFRFFLDQTTVLSPAMEVNLGLLHAPVVLGFLGALVHMVMVVVKNSISLIEDAQGKGSQGKKSQGKASQGEKSQGEKSQGKAIQKGGEQQ